MELRRIKGLNSRVLLDMIVPDLHELLLSVVHVREVVNHLARLDLQPLGIRPKAWRNKNVNMFRHPQDFTQDFSPVDLQPLGIRPKAWPNKNVNMFGHAQNFSPVDLQPLRIRPKNGEIKM